MKFTATLGDTKAEVLFDEAYGRRKLEFNGEALELSLLRLDGCRLRFTVDGRPVEALVTGQLPDLLVDVGYGPQPIQVEESRFAEVRRLSGLTTRVHAATDLKAPMPGLVTRVLVSAGDQVAVGTPLLVMEAMKMENELRASAAGTVAQIRVRPGEAVEVGAMLISFEPSTSLQAEPAT